MHGMFKLLDYQHRHFVCFSLICLAGLAVSRVRAAEPPVVAFDRALFDRMDLSINGGNGHKTATGGELAWGESYIMLGYVEMYRATGDRYYLDKLVDHADGVLKQRDDKRGFRDYSGRSRPAWSVGGKYTVAELVLKADDGADVIRFRSTRFAFNDQTRIQIKPRPDARLFDLVIENKHWKAREDYAGLSLDRGSPDCVERKVNACDQVAMERKLGCSDKGSGLVTVEIIGKPTGLPTHDGKGNLLSDKFTPMVPLDMAYHGYSGQATYPMLEFAWTVHQDPKLLEKYGRKAEEYVAEAIRVFKDAGEEWREGPQAGEGYYVTGERGCPFWTDNVGKAFNYQCSIGRSLLRLAQLTNDPKWERQTKAIARLFKRHLRVADNGSYVWNYSWGDFEKGWTKDNSPSLNTPTWKGYPTVEDISHGHLDVDFMRLCAETSWVFDREDMGRLAGTFLKNVVNEAEWTTSNQVDGQGGYGAHNTIIGGWCDLAVWEPRVAYAIKRVCTEQRIDKLDTGAAMWTVSRLVKWDGLLAKSGQDPAFHAATPATKPGR